MDAGVVEILCELIATPSVNPRLAPEGDDAAGESRLAARLARFCADAGWPWALQTVHPGRRNLLALVEGRTDAVELWEAHQDTVGVDVMHDPFAAIVDGGRVRGRGACDVKGGMSAMLAALRRAARQPAAERPTVILACTVNEECGFTGAKALADIWRPRADAEASTPIPPVDPVGGLTLERLRDLRPHVAIVAEPTDLNVVVAHRGVIRWQCHALGRAAHSSRPDQGANAIYAMTSVVRLIDEFHRRELASRPADPLCGPSAVCVTTIHGGTGANTVPDRAVIDVDRRLAPDEAPDVAVGELVDYLARHADLQGCRLEHDPPWMQSRGLSPGASGPWAQRLAGAARSAGVGCEIVGVPYGTNAATIAAAGIPAVVFGPGSIEQAHTVDEWIATDQLESAVEILCRMARGEA